MKKTKDFVPVQIPANAPYLSPRATKDQVYAIKAFFAGTASAAEQGLVWRFIAGVLADLQGFPYYPAEADMRFMMGRRFVGHHLVRFGQMSPEQIAKLDEFSPGQGGEDDEMPTL